MVILSTLTLSLPLFNSCVHLLFWLWNMSRWCGSQHELKNLVKDFKDVSHGVAEKLCRKKCTKTWANVCNSSSSTSPTNGRWWHREHLIFSFITFIFEPRSSLYLEWGPKRKREKRKETAASAPRWLLSACSSVSFITHMLTWYGMFFAGRLLISTYFIRPGSKGRLSLWMGWVRILKKMTSASLMDSQPKDRKFPATN